MLLVFPLWAIWYVGRPTVEERRQSCEHDEKVLPGLQLRAAKVNIARFRRQICLVRRRFLNLRIFVKGFSLEPVR
jgi:hypothetical protein